MNFISYKQSPLYDRVVEEYDIFEHSYDFMIFLAVLGYREDNPVRDGYEGSKSDGTRGQIGVDNFFSNELYQAIAACIAYQDTEDRSALVDRELQVERLIQYAAGGLEIAEEEFGSTAGDPTDAITNHVLHYEKQNKASEGILNEIKKDFSDDILDIE